MVWLVPGWKQKYHMSEPHPTPALNPILDKENKVKFRSNMGNLYHGLHSHRGGTWLEGYLGYTGGWIHVNIQVSQVQITQLQSASFQGRGAVAECNLGWLGG